MTCDLCDEPAVMHVCEIHDGVKTDRHLCVKHGQQAGLPNPATSVPGQWTVNGVACASQEQVVAQGLLDNLRGTRNFLRQHGRMPSTIKELKDGMSSPDDGPRAQIEEAGLLRELQRLDAMVRFIETNRRMPSRKEFNSLGFG
jgi:hypothetical protein